MAANGVEKSGDHQRKRCRYDQVKIFELVNVVFMWDGKLSQTDRSKVKIYNNRFHKEGGWRGTDVSLETTHIISNKWSAILNHHWDCKKSPFRISSSVKCVNYEWLNACLTVGELVPERFFRIDLGGGEPATQYANFEKACGVIGANGKWKYVGWKGWEAFKEEVDEPEAPKIAEAAIVKAEIAPKVKPGVGAIFDVPSWLEEAPERKLPVVIGPSAWLDD